MAGSPSIVLRTGLPRLPGLRLVPLLSVCPAPRTDLLCGRFCSRPRLPAPAESVTALVGGRIGAAQAQCQETTEVQTGTSAPPCRPCAPVPRGARAVREADDSHEAPRAAKAHRRTGSHHGRPRRSRCGRYAQTHRQVPELHQCSERPSIRMPARAKIAPFAASACADTNRRGRCGSLCSLGRCILT
jgi:hypothetical protein